MDTSSRSSVPEPDLRDSSAVHLELSRVLLGDHTLTEVLDTVAHLAKAALPEVDEVSVTLVDGDRARSVVFTGELAVQLDERQYETGFGPCLDAARTGEVVLVPDTSEDTRYPQFARQAARAGVGRTLSVGMPVPGRTVGGLNVYLRGGRGFDEDLISRADTFAAYAAVALANRKVRDLAEDIVRSRGESL